MNARLRQIDKAILMQKNPDLIALIRVEDDKPWRQMIFVPVSEKQVYKERYGDKIEFWFDEEQEVR